MVVALARLAGGFIKPVVSITAPVTLQARDTNFTLAFPRVITLGTAGAGGAAAAGTAPLTPLLWVEALGTGLAPQPRVAVEAGALPRRPVAFGCTGTPHGTAVAQVSCGAAARGRRFLLLLLLFFLVPRELRGLGPQLFLVCSQALGPLELPAHQRGRTGQPPRGPPCCTR